MAHDLFADKDNGATRATVTNGRKRPKAERIPKKPGLSRGQPWNGDVVRRVDASDTSTSPVTKGEPTGSAGCAQPVQDRVVSLAGSALGFDIVWNHPYCWGNTTAATSSELVTP
jgi:hypothetical protein